MPQIARVGDMGIGTCPCHTSPISYITIFASGSPNVTADGSSVVRVGDIGVASCGHPTIALSGSGISDADGISIHRIGDTGVNCGTYITISGSPTSDSL